MWCMTCVYTNHIIYVLEFMQFILIWFTLFHPTYPNHKGTNCDRSELFVAAVILWRHSACKYDYHPAWSKAFFFTAVSTNPDRKVCYSYAYESFMYKWHSNEWYIIESNVYITRQHTALPHDEFSDEFAMLISPSLIDLDKIFLDGRNRFPPCPVVGRN